MQFFALLTRDNGYLNIIQDTLSQGHRVIVLAEENCRTVLNRHAEVGATVIAIQREHDHGCRVQAVLHADGSGSVRQCKLQETLQETSEHTATALMQFFQELGYRQDSGMLFNLPPSSGSKIRWVTSLCFRNAWHCKRYMTPCYCTAATRSRSTRMIWRSCFR